MKARVFSRKKRHDSLCPIAGHGLADVRMCISTIAARLSAERLIGPQYWPRIWGKIVVPLVAADLARVVFNIE
ncbi:MAG: hypothetical protein O7B27_11410 [Gammaproteobacteria bacterium]|nr:hypothetical protein [Gammaproteobacteria bacterium]